MKNFILLLCTALTFLIAGCTGAGGGISENSHADSSVLDLTRPIQPPADLADKRVLVAFFSRTGENYEVGYIEKGNTHIVAEQIAALTKADAVFEIRTTAPYPVDYQEMTRVAKEEQAENARPVRAGLGLQGKFVQQHPEQAKLEIANWLATLGYTN